jgi:hypothetical protein
MKLALTLIVAVIIAGLLFVGYMAGKRAGSVTITHPTEYHFNVDSAGYDIYTEDMKLVGRLQYGRNNQLDSLIDADNQ